MAQDRLQKILARAGVASRRAAEGLITAGRIRVNGRIVTELGSKADPRRDKIELDGKRIEAEDLVYIVLHKPRGYVSTADDPEGRPTVTELVTDVPARLYPVGRLDFATSGVLLLTNDGDFTQGLLHPKKKVPKTYVVKLDQRIELDELDRWRKGIELEDGLTLPAEAFLLRHEEGKSWIQLTLREGRNQQIRRMAAATGFQVMRLARISFAHIDHDGLRPGDWRPLTVDELKKLHREFGVPKRVRGQASLFRLYAKLEDKRKRRPRFKAKRERRGRGAPRTAEADDTPRPRRSRPRGRRPR
ncbi:MAG: pseudouridine synthase [Myxococcota bacterium]